jgi:hypothetical protein
VPVPISTVFVPEVARALLAGVGVDRAAREIISLLGLLEDGDVGADRLGLGDGVEALLLFGLVERAGLVERLLDDVEGGLLERLVLGLEGLDLFCDGFHGGFLRCRGR